MSTTGEKFERAVAIMARLRAPGGCPWDREQTFDTIKPYTIEETYEVVEAIDNRDWEGLRGELGDLLLQVLFYAEMAAEEQRFSIDDVVSSLSDKLVRRHPHVFGEVKADTAGQVVKNWEALKAAERRVNSQTTGAAQGKLSGISSKMPALLEASKISNKAAGVGFDWPNINGLFEKLSEETRELQEHLKHLPVGENGPSPRTAVPHHVHQGIEDEIGDLFFVLVNIARYLSVDPESALRRTNRKFRQRFGWLENELQKRGKAPEEASLGEMEELWQQAKALEESR